MEITGNNIYRTLDLLNIYTKRNRAGYVTINGPKSFFSHTSVIEDGNILVFDGNKWICYDNRYLDPNFLVPNSREELHITFRSTDPNSPIWYTSDANREILVTLEVRGTQRYKE